MCGTRSVRVTGAHMPAGLSSAMQLRDELPPRVGGYGEWRGVRTSGITHKNVPFGSGLHAVPLVAVAAAPPYRVRLADLCHAFFSLVGTEKSAVAVVASLARESATDGGECRRRKEDPQNRRPTRQSRQGVDPPHRARSPCRAGRGEAATACACPINASPFGVRVYGERRPADLPSATVSPRRNH